MAKVHMVNIHFEAKACELGQPPVNEFLIAVVEIEPCVYVIDYDYAWEHTDLDYSDRLGINLWHAAVEDLDTGHSDAWYFDMSDELLWEDVKFGSYRFEANSIERLQEALLYVSFDNYDPNDI